MDASFTLQGDLLVPTQRAVSVWSDDMVLGHQISGLVAWGAERDHGDPTFQMSRLTVDMCRPVPMRPLRVVTRPVREGRRLRVIEVSVLDGDVEVTHGSALFLLRSEAPDATPPEPPAWDAALPDELPPPDNQRMSWEVRRMDPPEAPMGRVWMRELVPFVAGQQPSPALRAALSADFANPLVNGGGGAGLAFINADLTVYLARDPVGEWIGMEAVGHLGAEGIGIGVAWLHDRLGRFGQSSVAAMPDPRLRARQAATRAAAEE